MGSFDTLMRRCYSFGTGVVDSEQFGGLLDGQVLEDNFMEKKSLNFGSEFLVLFERKRGLVCRGVLVNQVTHLPSMLCFIFDGFEIKKDAKM
jgi:hypothetical protein